MFGAGSPIARTIKGAVVDPALAVNQLLASTGLFGKDIKQGATQLVSDVEKATTEGRARVGSSGFDDAVQARIPGLREDLPVKRDLLGNPKPNLSYGLSGVLGIATRDAEQTPLQREIQDIGFSFKPVEKKIRDVELDATAYEKYAKVSGDIVNQQLSNLISVLSDDISAI